MTELEANTEIGAVFGDVTAGPFDPEREHIPERRIGVARTIRRPAQFLVIPARRNVIWRNFGIGANMALRTRVVRELGGWDICIGPGATFGSGDDHDMAFRLLRAGHGLQFSPAARVLHHGSRSLAAMEKDSMRVGRAFGAAFAKYLRCAILYSGSLRTLRSHFLGFGLQTLRMRRGPHPSGPFIRGWLDGFVEGLIHPLDQKTHCFADASDTEESPAVATTEP